MVVTEVKQYPRKRILDILFAGGGNMKEWMPELRTAIDKHAREMGCDHIASHLPARLDPCLGRQSHRRHRGRARA